MAQIVRAQRAAVGVDYVLGVGGFDLDRVEGEVRVPLCSTEKGCIHASRSWLSFAAYFLVVGGSGLRHVEDEV